jgi:phage-related protein
VSGLHEQSTLDTPSNRGVNNPTQTQNTRAAHTARRQQKGIMSSTYVPLISSGVAGPLGVLHLPRLWLKASLEARGKLAAGYPGCGAGYDQMVLDGLGISKETFLNFIRTEKPTYPQLEAWVKKQPGVKLDKDSVEKLNAAIRGYIHKDEVRKGIFEANSLNDQSCSFRDAVNLNNLDDWKEFHAAALQ